MAHAKMTVLISIDTKMQLHMLLNATAQLQSSIWNPKNMNGLLYVYKFSPMIGYTKAVKTIGAISWKKESTPVFARKYADT